MQTQSIAAVFTLGQNLERFLYKWGTSLQASHSYQSWGWRRREAEPKLTWNFQIQSKENKFTHRIHLGVGFPEIGVLTQDIPEWAVHRVRYNNQWEVQQPRVGNAPGKVQQPCAREHPERSHSHTFVVFHYARFIRGDLSKKPFRVPPKSFFVTPLTSVFT